ncbi:MAG TPA: hypothetical protein ENN30_02120 [Candidatus Woesearchaeota archaeon]|nr:hypothetical protein [Candidatus Woesearchaeota archaeon]
MTVLDLHVHSALNGGYARPSEYAKRVGYLRENGYKVDGFVLTEHVKFVPADFFDDFLRKYKVLAFRGVEINTVFGHALLIGVANNSFRRCRIHKIQEIIDWSYDNNASFIPAHPFSNGRKSRWDYALPKLRGVYAIEGLNGAMSAEENCRAIDYAHRHKLKTTGGSDAHRLRQFARALTDFRADIESMDDLLDALAHGRYRPVSLEDSLIEEK